MFDELNRCKKTALREAPPLFGAAWDALVTECRAYDELNESISRALLAIAALESRDRIAARGRSTLPTESSRLR